METNLRRLELILKLTRIKPEWFYSISVTTHEVSFQGYKSDKLLAELSNFTFAPYEGTEYIISVRGDVTIVLT
jgi:hypothetical protein